MNRSIFFGAALVFLGGMIGCGSEEPTLVRDPMSKVTGQVLVDGKAESDISVKLNRVNGPDPNAGSSKMLTPDGFTDAEGKFSIGTYEGSGDGAADGEYTITFQWGMRSLMGGGYTGDKFAGKYIDEKKSEHKVTVAGKPVDLGVIQLSMPSGKAVSKAKEPGPLLNRGRNEKMNPPPPVRSVP